MFDEIPPPRAPRSQQFYTLNFAAIFAFFPILLAVTWNLVPHPLSLNDKFVLGGFALISLLSGVFLLNANSVTPRDNQELWGLVWATMPVLVILDVLGWVLR